MGLGGSYIGDGVYKERLPNGKRSIIYNKWRAMLQRCYGKSYIKRERTYDDCYVCEEWLNFQNFAKWMEENYYEIPGTKMHLDKDILKKGNKEYCPEYCCFVPAEINLIFSRNNSKNNKDDIGVDEIHKKKKIKYKARCRMSKGTHKTSKIYDTFEEAKAAYIEMKNHRIHSVAEKYKEYIPEKVYNILISIDVEKDELSF